MLIVGCCMACGLGGCLLLSACHGSVSRHLVSAQGPAEQSLASGSFFCLECCDWKSGKLVGLLDSRAHLLPAAHGVHYVTGPGWRSSSLEEPGRLFQPKADQRKQPSQGLKVSVLLLALSINSCKHSRIPLFSRRAAVVQRGKTGKSHFRSHSLQCGPRYGLSNAECVLLYPLLVYSLSMIPSSLDEVVIPLAPQGQLDDPKTLVFVSLSNTYAKLIAHGRPQC